MRIFRALLHHLGPCRKARLGYTYCKGRGNYSECM
jgi:hypothetical protein